jgi:ElaB/YqjD/DUF883 family membrane-anchored ribosome-binding protein
MGERDDAKHQVEQTRTRMSEIAHEVSRRMTPDYAKERAREMARHRASQVKDRAVESSWLLPLLGAGIGALVGRTVMTRAQERRDHDGDRFYGGRGYDARFDRYAGRYGEWGDDRSPSPYGDVGRGYPSAEGERTYGEGLSSGFAGESVSGGFSGESGGGKSASERATELKDQASAKVGQATAKVGEVRDRMMDQASHLRERLPDREGMRASAQEQPGMWALGAMALGALFGFAVPVSDRERRMIEPAKDKLRQAGEQALDKASEAMDSTSSEEREDAPRISSDLGSGTSSLGSSTSPDPLH